MKHSWDANPGAGDRPGATVRGVCEGCIVLRSEAEFECSMLRERIIRLERALMLLRESVFGDAPVAYADDA